MKLTVLGSNILAKPFDLEEANGIILLKNPKHPIRAEVKEIGDTGMKVRPTSIIWFYIRDAKEFPVNDEIWYIVSQDDVLVVEEDK